MSGSAPPAAGGMEGIADDAFVGRMGSGAAGVTYLAARPARLPIAADRVAVKC